MDLVYRARFGSRPAHRRDRRRHRPLPAPPRPRGAPVNLTAVVTVGDSGSSGRLREDMGMLPPGDVRNCIAALAEAEPLMRALFQYRFQNGNGLEGHSFGNLSSPPSPT